VTKQTEKAFRLDNVGLSDIEALPGFGVITPHLERPQVVEGAGAKGFCGIQASGKERQGNDKRSGSACDAVDRNKAETVKARED